MNIVLFDDPDIRVALLPFTFTRPVSQIRTGILTIAEKWNLQLRTTTGTLTEAYLSGKYPLTKGSPTLLINGALCPDNDVVAAVMRLQLGESLIWNNIMLATVAEEAAIPVLGKTKVIEYQHTPTVIDRVWKIFLANAEQIKQDIPVVTAGRKSAGIIDPHTIVYGAENLFVEEGAVTRAAIINAERGPVYLGKNSLISEGAVVRGSFALGEGSEVNVGAKVRGDTSIGPYCKVGGEVAVAVMFGHSNKSHDGYLGCSVIGEWCNFGADSNTSNLKNNYDTVKLWSHGKQSMIDSGLTFLGLMMGDHSKCGINSMFNTGTVVDVYANIFGAGLLPSYVPSFSWGGTAGMTTYLLDKALEVAERVLGRRQMTLSVEDKKILEHVFATTAGDRKWEPTKKHST